MDRLARSYECKLRLQLGAQWREGSLPLRYDLLGLWWWIRVALLM